MKSYDAKIDCLETNNIELINNKMSSIELSIKNCGSNSWRAFDKQNPISICYRYVIDGKLFEGPRTRLPYNISPQETIVIKANIIIEHTSQSEIDVKFDLVHEGKSWFEDYGSQPLILKINCKKQNGNSSLRLDDNYAVVLNRISKKYKIYSKPLDKIKEVFLFNRRSEHKDFWALKNISFKVKKGETYGIIGFNGSGKSTLLSILAQTKEPTDGTFIVNGRIAALLELGAGFHPEFTGRQNVLFNGFLHGMSKKEISNKINEIQDFSGIGDFFDKPVKSYSSGMFVRLAFSLAVSVDPDILIVDEALAVGDEVFQRKCYKKFEEFKAQGKTIIFVSHDLSAVRALCDRVGLLFDGNLIFEGSSNDVANYYQKMTLTANIDPNEQEDKKHNENRYGNGKATISSYEMLTETGQRTTVFQTGENIRIRVNADVHQYIQEPVIGIIFKTINGIEVFGTNTKILGDSVIKPVEKGQTLSCEFSIPLHLNEGTYFLSVGISDQANGETITVDRLVDATFFRVTSYIPCLGIVNLSTGAEVRSHVQSH
jgi:teichoic acid transport system ATP-binding protein